MSRRVYGCHYLARTEPFHPQRQPDTEQPPPPLRVSLEYLYIFLLPTVVFVFHESLLGVEFHNLLQVMTEYLHLLRHAGHALLRSPQLRYPLKQLHEVLGVDLPRPGVVVHRLPATREERQS